ncbi:CRISPR-associated protein Cas1 [Desulfurococcus amylolyticus 1221n]|uniref:CRISPR-associated endonuclease Cas1 n=1 Tax=Desulfurococcus amylolyticus (strain DSM 18924 / JCM 16383 / VKM B-2413 / 1221n) TaxID=490899 RepID=B8D4S7_DESA1|nr:CRISPR-associated endonuclease Cas1 [Desulfurococcus amylolyticus]ACL11108.1 CRISPR-associated protein Cas1 [Desulfurococcus amylolyticus 1221n]
MKTLIVSGYGVRLRYRKGLMLIESKNEKNEVPLTDLEQVVIETGGVWFSSKLIRKMVEYGIDFIVLDHRGYPAGRLYPPFISRTVETRRAQYAAYESWRGVHVMRELVYSKLANQAGLLKRYYMYTIMEELKDAYKKIIELAYRARMLEAEFEEAREKLRQLEAEAARIYWPSLSILIPKELGFNSRDQDSEDLVNTSLNYAYGILYGESWKVLVLAGLDPYAGFMHTDRSGKPVLAFDLIEMFRFTADSTLLAMYRHGWKPRVLNGLLDYESRARIVESIMKTLENTKTRYIDETPITLRQAMKKVTMRLASFLRGESGFEGFVHGW